MTLSPSFRLIEFIDQVLVPLAVPLPPRLLDQVTFEIPTLSLAVPPVSDSELDAGSLIVGC